MVKILITGGSGLLGTELQKRLKGVEGIDFLAPSSQELDIRLSASVAGHIFSYYPNIIIHAAAATKERMKHISQYEAIKTNYLSAFSIADFAKKIRAKVFYISTDYVFDGIKGNYREYDEVNPIDRYSLLKYISEEVFLESDHNVIRTTFCKRPWPYDFAFVDKFSSKDYVDVIVPKIITCILYMWYANISCEICHIGSERKSWFDLAKESKPDVLANSIKGKGDIPPDTSFNLNKMDFYIQKTKEMHDRQKGKINA